MDEEIKEWYYTSGPDQAGPVTFGELKARAAASELHPRNDMVWKESMDEWVPAGQIDGLFQKRIVDAAAEAMVSSIAAMEENKPQAPAEVDLWPGASRRWYMLFVMLFPVLWLVICLTFASFVGDKLTPGFQKLFLLIGLIVPVWVVIDVSLSRLSNLGMNKLWFFAHFIPVLNLWLGYRAFACPAGYAKSKKLDPIGWFLAIFYWLFMISSVVLSLVLPAVIATTLQNSDFIEKLETLREQVEASAGDKKDAPNEQENQPEDEP